MASNSFFVGSRLKSIFVDAHDFARNQRNTTGGGMVIAAISTFLNIGSLRVRRQHFSA